MRSIALISSVFAAGAFAGVINLDQRDVVTQTEIDVVTKVVMVTAGASVPAQTQAPAVPSAAPAPVAAAPVPAAPAPKKHHHKHHHKQQPVPDVTPDVQSNPEPAPAPVPAAPKVPQVPQPAAVAAAPQGLGGYASVAVQAHNSARQAHSAPAVAWDDALAQSAAALAAGCVFEHNVDLGPASSYGQNIASSSPATGTTAAELRSVISSMWYSGEADAFSPYYGQASPDMTYFDSWGHFTQVVWKDTKKVGCATQNCPSMGYFTVCNYSPPGNYAGQYAQNVSPS